jgi:hypothetical protein
MDMDHPPSAVGAPPLKGGAASGPAKPDPRRPLGYVGVMHRAWRFGVTEN